ncbi:MAG: hypothetical protein ACON5O_05120 [Lentimonas sp.]
MGLLNAQFILLLVKMVVCVLPGILGIFLLVSSEEAKRSMRNSFCKNLFGVGDAIKHTQFQRFLTVIGIVGILFSLAVTWFGLLRHYV